MNAGLLHVFSRWSTPKNARSFYDPTEHGPRRREMQLTRDVAGVPAGTTMGRNEAKRRGFLLTKKQRSKLKRALRTSGLEASS